MNLVSDPLNRLAFFSAEGVEAYYRLHLKKCVLSSTFQIHVGSSNRACQFCNASLSLASITLC